MAKTDDPALDPSQSYESAMRALIARRWAAVWAAVPVAIAGEDIEGVHDVRVASRRLRAAMDVAVACFPASWYAPLHRVAKEITGALGEVRDRDVMIESLTRSRKKAPAAEHPGIDRLIARLERERDAAREEMVRFLDGLMTGDLPRMVAERFGPEAALAGSVEDVA
jgi:triphosphatase